MLGTPKYIQYSHYFLNLVLLSYRLFKNLKRYISFGTDQISSELNQAGCKTSCSKILTNFFNLCVTIKYCHCGGRSLAKTEKVQERKKKNNLFYITTSACTNYPSIQKIL